MDSNEFSLQSIAAGNAAAEAGAEGEGAAVVGKYGHVRLLLQRRAMDWAHNDDGGGFLIEQCLRVFRHGAGHEDVVGGGRSAADELHPGGLAAQRRVVDGLKRQALHEVLPLKQRAEHVLDVGAEQVGDARHAFADDALDAVLIGDDNQRRMTLAQQPQRGAQRGIGGDGRGRYAGFQNGRAAIFAEFGQRLARFGK